MIRDIFLFVSHNDGTSTSVPDPVIGGMTNSEDVEKAYKLMEDANISLYPEYEKMVKFEFIIQLHHANAPMGSVIMK